MKPFSLADDYQCFGQRHSFSRLKSGVVRSFETVSILLMICQTAIWSSSVQQTCIRNGKLYKHTLPFRGYRHHPYNVIIQL